MKKIRSHRVIESVNIILGQLLPNGLPEYDGLR